MPHASAAAMGASLLALVYVAPLAAQGTASLLDLLSNPTVDQMPALVLAPNDGVMLAGKPMIPSLPTLPLTARPGDAVAKADGQRLPGAVPQVTALASVPPERLTPHYPNPENAEDRALLEAILGSPLPSYLVKIEPAINAPKWQDNVAQLGAVPPGVTALPGISSEQPWTKVDLTAMLAALKLDKLKLADGFADLPPPPPPPLVRQPLTAVVPDLVTVPRVTPDALTPYLPNAAIPADRAMLEVALGVPLPEPYATQATMPPPALTGKELDQALQTELIRVNCLKGTADGNFGSGSKGALDLFFAKSKLQPASVDRSQAVLDQIVAASGSICDKPYAPPQATATQPATSKPAQSKPATPAKPTAPAGKPKKNCKTNPEECASNG